MSPVDRDRLSIAQHAALALIRIYKVLFSPIFAGSCRYLPSCSDYAAQAINRFGVLKGTWLAARRLAHCHPFGSHGLDPVPESASPAVTQDQGEAPLRTCVECKH